MYCQQDGPSSNLSILQQKEVIFCSFQSTVRTLPLLCKTILYSILYILESACFLSITCGRLFLTIINKSTDHQDMAFLYKPCGMCKNAVMLGQVYILPSRRKHYMQNHRKGTKNKSRLMQFIGEQLDPVS